MSDSCSRRAVLTGTGAYLPEKILSNADLAKLVDTNDAWIVERTGIRRRRVAERPGMAVDQKLMGQALRGTARQAAQIAEFVAHELAPFFRIAQGVERFLGVIRR